MVRRPIAPTLRLTAGSAVRLCMRWHIHPDTISYCSIGASALAAICFWQATRSAWLLVIGPMLCLVRLWLNMLDGMVAVTSGQTSRRGEILNDLPDRISDVLIFVGVAHSGLVSAVSGYWAAIASLLTAYVGMLGQAVGSRREFGGVMSKPWRMVALQLGATAHLAGIGSGNAAPLGGLTILDWTCLAVVVGCIQTIGVRLRRTFESLAAASISSANESNRTNG